MAVFREDPFQRIVNVGWSANVLLAVRAEMVYGEGRQYSDDPQLSISGMLSGASLWGGSAGPVAPYARSLYSTSDDQSQSTGYITVIDQMIFWWGYTLNGVRSGNIGDIRGIRRDGRTAEQDALHQAQIGYVQSPYFGNPDDVFVTPDPFQDWQTQTHQEPVTLTQYNSIRKELILVNVKSDLQTVALSFGQGNITVTAWLYKAGLTDAFSKFLSFVNGPSDFPGQLLAMTSRSQFSGEVHIEMTVAALNRSTLFL